MDHRLFETWLLEKPSLTPDQRHVLQAHMRGCKTCAALAEVNLALQHTGMARPSSGFTGRFRARLASHRVEQRRQTALGGLALVVGALGLFAWLLFPFLSVLSADPAQALTVWATNLIVLVTSAQVYGQAGAALIRVLGGMVPAFIWMIMLSALAGAATLWSFTIWKTTQVTRRV